MMPELTLSSGEAVLFNPSSLRKFRGIRLPGSEYWLAERNGMVMHFQEYTQPGFSISYRIFQTQKNHEFTITEKPETWRIETVLEGSLIITDPEQGEVLLNTGDYHVTQQSFNRICVTGSSGCKYMVAQLTVNSTELTRITDRHSKVQRLPQTMQDVLHELLNNRFRENLLPFYYENCVRELFFFHAARPASAGEKALSKNELDAVHHADRIIRENLHVHFSIQELAKKTGTNEYKLKKDFRIVLGTGLFGRLMQLRMQQAKTLLETTSLPVKDIAEQAGYETVAGFITAFRKKYGLPPREWRVNRKLP